MSVDDKKLGTVLDEQLKDVKTDKVCLLLSLSLSLSVCVCVCVCLSLCYYFQWSNPNIPNIYIQVALFYSYAGSALARSEPSLTLTEQADTFISDFIQTEWYKTKAKSSDFKV